jgi:Zn-dependent protease with chaperone function
MMKRGLSATLAALSLSACGTAYQMPVVAEAELARAETVIARESAAPVTAIGILDSIERFERVAARIEPHAEAMCRSETPDRNCDLDIRIDLDPRASSNAYQTVVDRDRPLIVITAPLLQGTRNDDEVAFVMGHKAGHHIASHIDKLVAQQMAGALILGMAAAYAGAGSADQYQAQQNVEAAMNAGAAIGGAAFSQTYELEADMLGAYIAEAAGYDAEKGSLIFARRDYRARGVDGAMSLWSTHPRSPERIAIAMLPPMLGPKTGRACRSDPNGGISS